MPLSHSPSLSTLRPLVIGGPFFPSWGVAGRLLSGCSHLGRLLVGFRMTSEEFLPIKLLLSETDFKVMARDELILRWKHFKVYMQALEGKYTHRS